MSAKKSPQPILRGPRMKKTLIVVGTALAGFGGAVSTVTPKLLPTWERELLWIGLGVVALGFVVSLIGALLPKSAARQVKGAVHIVRSKGQTGGITAHTVNMAPQQRTLDDPEVRRLLADPIGDLDSDRPVEIGWSASDNEAASFGEEIAKVLESQGATVTRLAYTMTGVPPGVRVYPEHNRIIVGPRAL
ncbi:hypothetical protein [Brevundimonas naejangsanensis]|uniref:hypothetical protein n=1 Tax=Brevundimonas naejangsanensis TaxID=588932 RepID=UPI0039F6CCCC